MCYFADLRLPCGNPTHLIYLILDIFVQQSESYCEEKLISLQEYI